MLWITQSSRWYEQLRDVDNISDSTSELKAVHDMNDSKSLDHNSRYYEQLKVVVDMNHFKSWA